MSQLTDLLHRWKEEPSFMANVTRWEVLPAVEGDYRDFPSFLDQRLQAALRNRGIARLYRHQAEAFPGGVGYSEELYRIYRQVFQAAREVIARCGCSGGCPSCVGPSPGPGGTGKAHTMQLLEVILK